ncbi:hypothetical protein Gotur_004115 [Gossypium turneri]
MNKNRAENLEEKKRKKRVEKGRGKIIFRILSKITDYLQRLEDEMKKIDGSVTGGGSVEVDWEKKGRGRGHGLLRDFRTFDTKGTLEGILDYLVWWDDKRKQRFRGCKIDYAIDWTLKVKYYSLSTFLEGIIILISGGNISVRDDAWIPESVDYKVQNRVTNSSITRVEATGEYTMRSGYKKAIQDTNANNEPYLYRNYYKKLWHTEAPSKNGCETLEHVFWDCVTAKEEWGKLEIWWPQNLSVKSLIIEIIWAIWTSRNRVLHERHNQLAQEIVEKGPSVSDLIRIKFDGAFQRSTNESCPGLVVRRPDRTVTQIGVDLGLQRVEIKGNALRKKWVGSHASNGGYEEEKANLSGRRSVPVCKEENGGGNLNRPMKHWGKDGA